ncbi:MAG: glycosyltransferase family 2 protein [Anaerolineaceae bacterium]
MISFVIPAHNEERLLARTLRSLHAAVGACGEPFEIIVVDDSSTDRTAAIAVEHGARVIRVANRQISATRNSGARKARGRFIFFVDADTLVDAAVVGAALEALRVGAIGGGCHVRFDGRLPLSPPMLEVP